MLEGAPGRKVGGSIQVSDLKGRLRGEREEKKMKKGIYCHMDMSGVMANAGEWNNLVIRRGDQMVEVPTEAINKKGLIKKSWIPRIKEAFKKRVAA